MTRKPVALIILDGWGVREMEHGNAVKQAHTPNYTRWSTTLERSLLDASGPAVGLVADQMGNSEVGHLNLGAGLVVFQDITRIDNAIQDGSFFTHIALTNCFEAARKQNRPVHLIGLLGAGGVHAHDRHLYALLQLAQRYNVQVIVHVITDGRDTPPRSALEFAKTLGAYLKTTGAGIIGTVSGRYYAMDRDKRWERTKLAYDAMMHGKGLFADSAVQGLERSYATDITDEFVLPTVIVDPRNRPIASGDCVVLFNFRADRMRQLVKTFALPNFDGFERGEPKQNLSVLTMTAYEDDLPVQVLFPQHRITNPLARVLADHGKNQFHAAETEKYAHVTYFFNGGREEPFEGEERALVPSPKVATYDLKPEMSAVELADKVIERIRTQDDDFILVNFANPDMVGHTGVLSAAIRAVETVDTCAARIVDEVLKKGGAALVTADHGNAERMIDEMTGEPHTYHTTSPVAFFVITNEYVPMRPRGILADVAPTVLDLLGIPQPAEMTGRSLIQKTPL